jgi:4-oxalocrotonate tautomerase
MLCREGLRRQIPVSLSAQADKNSRPRLLLSLGGQRLAAIPPQALHLLHPEEPMPTYHVEMMEGRTIEQKKKLVEAITRVSVEILGGQPESVDILITDVKRENWATGGKLWSEPRD